MTLGLNERPSLVCRMAGRNWPERTGRPHASLEESRASTTFPTDAPSRQSAETAAPFDDGMWSGEDSKIQPPETEDKNAGATLESSKERRGRTLTAKSFVCSCSADLMPTDFLWKLYCRINSCPERLRFSDFHLQNSARIKQLERDLRATCQDRGQKHCALRSLQRERVERLRSDVDFLVSSISTAVSESLWPAENIERFSQRLDKISTREEMVMEYRTELLKKHKSSIFESWLKSGKPDHLLLGLPERRSNKPDDIDRFTQTELIHPKDRDLVDAPVVIDENELSSRLISERTSRNPKKSNEDSDMVRVAEQSTSLSRDALESAWSRSEDGAPVLTETDEAALKAARDAARLRRKARLASAKASNNESQTRDDHP